MWLHWAPLCLETVAIFKRSIYMYFIRLNQLGNKSNKIKIIWFQYILDLFLKIWLQGFGIKILFGLMVSAYCIFLKQNIKRIWEEIQFFKHISSYTSGHNRIMLTRLCPFVILQLPASRPKLIALNWQDRPNIFSSHQLPSKFVREVGGLEAT